MKTIVDFNQVWVVDNKFGVSVRLKQVMMMPNTELSGCAFSGGDDDDEDDFIEGVVKEENGSSNGSEQEDI